VALVAMAMGFSLCTDVMGDFERVFKLKKALVGQAVGSYALGATVAIFIGGAVLDFLGMSRALWIACAAHLIGISTIIFAQGFWSLLLGWVFMGIASGMIEASINPLVATTYPDRKTHMLNVLHAWWPGGLVIGGLAGYAITKMLHAVGASQKVLDASWQIKMGVVYLPVLLYASLILGQNFPKTERVQAGVSTKAMFREALRPLFLLLIFCMFLTASTELGPNRWVGVFIQDIIGIRGVLFLVYTSGLMFLLRFFAGPLAHRLSPIGMMVGSSILSGIGLFTLSYSHTAFTVFVAATVFGVGIAYFWPTMLGITSERFPKGGALLLGLMGGSGNLFIGLVTIPAMGWLHDHYTVENLPAALQEQVVLQGRVDEDRVMALDGQDKQSVDAARRTAASTTFRWVAALPVVLTMIFSGVLLHDRRKGGYKKEILIPSR
jgi:MFS family permease